MTKQKKHRIKYQLGDRYSHWVLIGESIVKDRVLYVKAICDCGTIRFINLYNAVNGRSKSCGCEKGGCVKKDIRRTLYGAWANMKQRCYNENHRQYKDYGARGITMCEAWLTSFKTFCQWAISSGWKKGLSIDRINNNEGYSPDNCRWATDAMQTRNTRHNLNIEAFGEVKCVRDWANDYRSAVSVTTIIERIKILKMDAEEAITQKHAQRKNGIMLTFEGATRCLAEWCELLKLSYVKVHYRIKHGWTIEDAFKI